MKRKLNAGCEAIKHSPVCRVLLNIGVLAGRICGEINIHKRSAYAMLDNAALQTVRNWRFLPARQAGHTVDKWFMIPVQFSLKDNAA
jgi:periplasmic protein TonB